MPSPTSSDTVAVDPPVDTGVTVVLEPRSVRRALGFLRATWGADPWRVVRWVGLVAYVAAAVFQYRYGMPWSGKGLPLEREQVIAWFLVGSVIWSLGRSRIEIVYAIAGWGALAVCFILYDFTRGAIDQWWGSPTRIPGAGGTIPAQSIQNADRVLTAERALFFGIVPTEWLQERFYEPGRPGPRWEVVTALTYLSHFVVVYLVALVMWMRNRQRWVDWVRALVTLIVLGVAGYLLMPTAPPWLAHRYGLMDEVGRPGTRALRHIGFETADRIWTKGQATVNIVAAMPSLHFGFAALVLFFFWRTARNWVRVVLVAYVVVMGFTLAYGGEHYVLDCVAGGALAWLAVWINRRIDAWRAERSERTSANLATDRNTTESPGDEHPSDPVPDYSFS